MNLLKSFKNFLLKTAVRSLKNRVKPHRRGEERRILVVTTTGLGDTLWATPAIESLRKSFPNAHIAALSSPIGAEVLKHNPYLSKIYALKKFSYGLWKTLYQDRFDTVLLFHASQRLTLPLCSLLGAQTIVGTSKINKGFDFLLTDPLEPNYEHEIQRRLKIMEKTGGKVASENLSFFLQPEEKMPQRSGCWIALHPGSKDAFKRWPAQNFIELGRELKRKLNCEILITGTREEESLMKHVAKEIPGAHLADSNLPLRSFAALVEQMNLLICNDSGPFHIACALNKPVIGIYSSTDPRLCGPHMASKAFVVAKRRTCEPCLKRGCKAPFCFLQIGTGEVLRRALEVICA